jgi:hypothetical protein
MCVDASRSIYYFVDFLLKVMIRDGYTCILTGFQDSSHPKPAEGTPKVRLVGAHILRRAIGEFDEDHNSKSVRHLSIRSTISR